MTNRRWLQLTGIAGLVAALAAPAIAGDAAGDAADGPAADVPVSARFADDGAFSPVMVRAGSSHGALGLVTSSWDGVRDRIAVDVGGELKIWGPVRVVAHVSDVTRDSSRPAVGAGIAFLDEARNGVAATGYLFYRTAGWTAPEGEVEAQLAFGKRLGPVRTTLNVAYGQDPEADDFEGEVALAGQVSPARGLYLGAAGRYRDALGSHAPETTMKREVVAGATAVYAFDRFAVSALAGVAAIETVTAPMTTGPAATLSVGAAF